MEAEHLRPGVGLAQRIHDGSGDIAGAAGTQQYHHGRSGIGGHPEQSHERDAGHAENNIDKNIKPARRADPDDMDDERHRGADPHARDDGITPEWREREGNGRISAGDQQKDVHMVDATEHIGNPW